MEDKIPDDKKPTISGDGAANGALIIGRTVKALKRAGFGHLVDEYQKEAKSGDYDHLLQTTMAYVEID